MATYSTDIHGPSGDARETTGEVARCSVCDTEWQVRSFDRTDAKGCPFCQAGEKAISIHDESPTFGGATIVR